MLGAFLVRLLGKRHKPFGQTVACVFSLSLLDGHNTGFRFRSTGTKSIPTQVHIENGFSLDMEPRAVMEARTLVLHPFTEEFLHGVDSEGATSVAEDVSHRWRSDGQRFPPRAYEARNLVWKGSDPLHWRTLNSAERFGDLRFSCHSFG